MRLTPIKAAPRINMTAAQLMAWLRTGTCPFGIYLKKDGNSRGEYVLFEKRMEVFIEGEDLVKQSNLT